jgi:hypothetical protein
MSPSLPTAVVSLLLPCLLSLLLLHLSTVLDPDPDAATPRVKKAAPLPLRFRYDGAFKILQVSRPLWPLPGGAPSSHVVPRRSLISLLALCF